jgi:hypothetical protein
LKSAGNQRPDQKYILSHVALPFGCAQPRLRACTLW